MRMAEALGNDFGYFQILLKDFEGMGALSEIVPYAVRHRSTRARLRRKASCRLGRTSRSSFRTRPRGSGSRAFPK
jgi:hypothetical protein